MRRLAAPWNAEGYHLGVSLCVDLETLCCVWVIWVSYLGPKRLIGIFDSVGRRAAQNHPPVARELAQRGDLAAGTSEGNRFVKADHRADIAQKPENYPIKPNMSATPRAPAQTSGAAGLMPVAFGRLGRRRGKRPIGALLARTQAGRRFPPAFLSRTH